MPELRSSALAHQALKDSDRVQDQTQAQAEAHPCIQTQTQAHALAHTQVHADSRGGLVWAMVLAMVQTVLPPLLLAPSKPHTQQVPTYRPIALHQ